ncbi:XRE family transcriptional regulator [Candidatus Desulfofervidus auxilii]|uniref:XRE family transcriptional regulator n=2 Tax=Desulfofervidus auxilii TaxID=1621989 RepID=A0A7U4TH43_DESA2|nr:XRE family transcriptional regulator [Candidatus Desulfofervidus auxilii]
MLTDPKSATSFWRKFQPARRQTGLWVFFKSYYGFGEITTFDKNCSLWHFGNMATVGEILKEVREGKRISIDKAAADTKLSVFYLEAIEANNWQALPAPAYIRGYLRLYASYLGLSPDKIITQYEEQIAHPIPEAKIKKTNYKPIILGVIFVLFFLSLSWYLSEKNLPTKQAGMNKLSLQTMRKKGSLGKTIPAQISPPLSKTQLKPEKKTVLDISVKRISVCLDIKDREPIHPQTQFHLTAPTPIYCFTEILGAKKPTKVRHIWLYKGKVAMAIVLPIRSARWRTWSRKIIYPDLKGKWEVIILGPKKEKLTSIEFTVK